MSAVWLLLGILIGYFGCYYAPKERKAEEPTVMVKRNRPSLRNPLKTHKVSYDKYRSKETGLYQPGVAKAKKEDIELER